MVLNFVWICWSFLKKVSFLNFEVKMIHFNSTSVDMLTLSLHWFSYQWKHRQRRPHKVTLLLTVLEFLVILILTNFFKNVLNLSRNSYVLVVGKAKPALLVSQRHCFYWFHHLSLTSVLPVLTGPSLEWVPSEIVHLFW